MHRRARALLLGGAATAVALTALIAPSSDAATAPARVQGGVTQAFRAVSYVKPVKTVVPTVRYYLTGAATDDASKLAGAPTAGFGRTAPNGNSDVTQTTNPLLAATGGDSSNPGTAFWTGAFSGRISGKVEVHWWWDTVNATGSLGDNLIARLVADPGTAQEKVLGEKAMSVNNADGMPHEYVVSVDVDGTVAKTLQLVGDANYVDSSEGLTAHYGSATAPSYFAVPTGVAPPVKQQVTLPVKDTAPLVVASTKIGRKAAEPTIGVSKKGNAFITAADFDGLSPATPRTLIYSSSDGNRSWHNVSPLVAGQPTPPTTADPYVYVDPTTGRIFNDDLTLGCSYLQWSDDEGKTWEVGNPLACESPVDDHQTVVAGKPRGGATTSGYPNVVYYCVNKVVDVQCARSFDGGRTMTFTGSTPFVGVDATNGDGEEGSGPQVCGGLHGHIAVDPEGRLLLPKGHCGKPYLAVSEDNGSSWNTVLVNRMAVASHQTSVASDSAGNLYYLWIGADDLRPYLSVSRDHGRTWGPAWLVSPPGVAAVNFPSIDAAGPGHVALAFPGTTDPLPSAARKWNYYVMVSTNADRVPPVFHSTTAQPVADPIHRGACLDRCAGMYDFIDVVIVPKTKELWAAAVDTCTSVKCIAAEGPNLPSGSGADDAQGMAVRQLSGAGLTGRPELPVTPAAPRPAPTTSPGGGLAATGLATTLPLVGLVALLLAGALRVRRT